MKSLGYMAARRCENAMTKRCRCRCRGALHGVERFGPAPNWREFWRLPLDDPHRIKHGRRAVQDRLPLPATP